MHRHVYVHTHNYVYCDVCTYIHKYIRTYVRTYVQTYVHMYIQTYVRMYIRICSVYIVHLHSCTHVTLTACLLFLQAGNQTATIVALCSLLDFDLKQDTSQLAIRDVGGMDLLVNLLETNDLKCRIGALKIMTELTQNTQTRIDITNLGGR